MDRPPRPSSSAGSAGGGAQHTQVHDAAVPVHRPSSPASPVPDTLDEHDDAGVPEILVSPASPMAPALPVVPRQRNDGDEDQFQEQGGAAGEGDVAGGDAVALTREAERSRAGRQGDTAAPPQLAEHTSRPSRSQSTVPTAAPAPAPTPARAPAPAPPSEARSFFASLSSSLPSVSLPSFNLNFSSFLPSRLPGAPSLHPYPYSSDDESTDNEAGAGAARRERDRRDSAGRARRGGKEADLRRSMDLRIEQATDGPSLVSDSHFPSPGASSSSPSPSKPAFATLARTPSSAFVAASAEGRVNPLTLQAIARRDSELEAIRVVRARAETERRRENSADSAPGGGASAGGEGADRPALLRKESWTKAAARVAGSAGWSESPPQLSEEERGLRRKAHARGGGSRDLGFVGEEDDDARQESVDTVRAGAGSSHARTSTAASSASSDVLPSARRPFPMSDAPPRARNASTASTASDAVASEQKKKKGAFRSLFSRPRSASQASVASAPAPAAQSARATSPAPSGTGTFPGLAVESPTVERRESLPDRAEKVIRPKVRTKGKSTKDFASLFLAQELVIPASFPSTLRDDADSQHSTAAPLPDNMSQHSRMTGAGDDEPGPKKRKAVWAMKFSEDGRYLAVGGKDGVVRVWEVLARPEDRDAARNPSASTDSSASSPDSPTGSRAFPRPTTPSTIPPTPASTAPPGSRKKASVPPKAPACVMPVFTSKPVREFRGHEADVLDLSWSKNNFLLSSSMDKTVRLWHVSRNECLCAFQHLDFVTSIAFHPKDDRFFLSGSLDCKLRLWNIPEKRVHIWTELPELITAVSFTRDGKLAIAGTFVGAVMFFLVETFQYHAQVTAKSTRGKNSKGKKVTSLTPFPLPSSTGERLLVTTNDSRLRLYHTADKIVETKYAGHENTSSQIRASFSDDGRWIISGSEDRNVFIWDSGLDPRADGGYHLRKKHKESPHEYFPMAAHIVTAAVFAPTMTRTHLAAAGDPVFADGHTHMAPLERTLSGTSLGLVGVETRNTTLSSLDASGLLVPATSREGFAGAADGGAADAIIVVADDETGVISIFRNSQLAPRRSRLWGRKEAAR